MKGDSKAWWKSYQWIIILLIANTLLWVFANSTTNRRNEIGNLFAIEDTTRIESVYFTRLDKSWSMYREANWKIDSVPSDQQLRTILFTLFQKVRVQRQLSDDEASKIRDFMDPILVTINTNSKTKNFNVYWNPLRSKTYFGEEDLLFEVEIPGYRDFLGSIFDLEANQWYDRFVMNNNERTIQKVELVGKEIDLEINFNGTFFTVKNVSKLDSALLSEYLNAFSQLFFDGWYPSSQNSFWDSVAVTSESWKLTLEDIYNDKPLVFQISKNPINKGNFVVKNERGNYGMLPEGRVVDWFKSYTYFERKNP